MSYTIEKLKAKRCNRYKKELKSLFKEYTKVINTVYSTEDYNKWKKKVIRLFNEIKDKELFEKYLEVQIENCKIDNTVYGMTIGATIAVVMEKVTEKLIDHLDNGTIVEAIFLVSIIGAVLFVLIFQNYKKNDYTIFYSECLSITKKLNKAN